MNFTQSITSCMSKFATFSGRASRSEFWWFYLFTILISWASSIVSASMYPLNDPMIDLLPGIVSLVFIMPGLAVGARRLHDIGRSGWWQLLFLTVIGIILLIVWWATETKSSGDRFEENIKIEEVSGE